MRRPVLLILSVLCMLLAVSCAGIYGMFPELFPGKAIDEQMPEWNTWLGKTKADRSQAIGPPTQCDQITSGGERCDWIEEGEVGGREYDTGQGSFEPLPERPWKHRLSYTYDQQSIARSWSYEGSWGERTSQDKKEP